MVESQRSGPLPCGSRDPARPGAPGGPPRTRTPRMPAPTLPAASRSPVFRDFLATLTTLGSSDATVLLTGEVGAGKVRAARSLHAASGRHPLVEISLAALAPSLVESALFGHEAGAFTDAKQARLGCFRRADGGTLVLEDVDLLPLDAQVKLLRVLQERVVEPVGAEAAVPVEVRLVATTSTDLAAGVAAGTFREDLYFRLAVVPLEVPPLRVHLEDLPDLAAACLAERAEALGLAPRTLTDDGLANLAEHPWPGNLRELENALERALVLSGETTALGPDAFAFLGEAVAGVSDELARRALAAGLTVGDLEEAMMRRAVDEERGNLSAASRRLGITRRALEYRLKALDEDAADGAEGGA